jgi:beta-mannosidase
VSDRLQDFKAELSVSVITMDGTVISQQEKSVRVPKNSSTILFSETAAQLLNGKPRGDVILSVSLTTGNKAYRNIYYFTQQKDMNYPAAIINRRINPVDGGFNVTLSSAKFMRGVYLSTEDDSFFEDNFFDLLPDKSTFVKVKSSLSQEAFEKQLKTTSLSENITQ